MSKAKPKARKNIYRCTIVAFIAAVILNSQMKVLAIEPLFYSSTFFTPALSIKSNFTNNQVAERKTYIPPSRGTPRPANTQHTGSRGDCNRLTPPLVTMVPSDKELGQNGPRIQNSIGLTFNSHPVFWFYIPRLPSDVVQVKFRIQDSTQEQDLYDEDINLGMTPVVIGFKLPNSEPGLELNTQYKWIVSIACNTDESPLSAEAWIERVQPNFTLNQRPNDQEVQRYGSSGFLHETLTYSAIFRNRGQRYVDLWSNLLRELHLSAIATEANVQSVNFELEEQ